MDTGYPVTAPKPSYDIFNLTDDALRERLEFKEEIGYGNWGSVWLCSPKSKSMDGFDRLHRNRLAVKLVHRHPNDSEKSKTTAARVKSLWNEMKIVGSFKTDPHPSIISFYSFIVTPSFALITMACHPDVVPVEVDETQARVWFRFLLSGVEFLHKRGIAHNDIKPANILISHKSIPVLIDFGFAERYDLASSKAFLSNLSYGTPEYLSPERARGQLHDTRKSDTWSLGATFFEILIGRTPFEESDKEEFVTREDLEKYWSRTVRGKWMGSWKMSLSMEKLLRRMLSSNADLRYTATEAINDPYWKERKDNDGHRRSSSVASSIVFERDLSKLLDGSPSPKSVRKVMPGTPPGLQSPGGLPRPEDLHGGRRTVTKTKSQPKVNAMRIQGHRQKRVPVPNLPAIAASPPTSPAVEIKARRPLVVANGRENRPLRVKSSNDMMDRRKSAGMLAELSGVGVKNRGRGKENHVNQRVREWERERERLREISRLEELERERDEEIERSLELEKELKRARALERALEKKELEGGELWLASPEVSRVQPSVSERRASPVEILRKTPSPNDSTTGFGSFRHSIKNSIDKTMRFYKTSNTEQVSNKNLPALPTDGTDDEGSRRSCSARESWEDDALVREAKTSLPVVRHAIHNERMAADNQNNRMAIWMRNVEKVVEDARQTFQAPSSPAPLPPLPLAPASHKRSNRSSRVPRRVLAANKIFAEANEQVADQTMSSYVTSVYASPDNTGVAQQPATETPSPSKRRATVSAGSTGAHQDDVQNGSPSRKSRSHGNLFQLHIAPVSMLEEMSKRPSTATSTSASPSPRLSEVIDKNIFIAPPTTPIITHSFYDADEANSTPVRITKSFDELTSSPLYVEPYPPREPALGPNLPDTPSQRRLENVYDRFLMATSGVKRAGKGYESDNFGAVHNTVHVSSKVSNNNSHRAFYSARRAMPPPVSSDDHLKAISVDELGIMTRSSGPSARTVLKDENINTTSTFMRRAMKGVSKRLSRLN